MALTLTLTFEEPLVTQIVEAMAAQFSYQSMVGGEPNPETKEAFARRILVDVVRGGALLTFIGDIASKTAAAQAQAVASGVIPGAMVTVV